MSDMWVEASADHELEAREASLDRADAEMMPVYAFLFQSRTARELEHRLAFAAERIERVAAACGLPAAELEDTARRRYALLKEALPEGVDPVTPVLQAGQGFGSGAEQPIEHNEGPDFSHSYAEVPLGPLGGPPPNVVTPQEPEIPSPLAGQTASLCRCGSRLTKKSGKCKACREQPGACQCMRATALTSGSPPSGPPLSNASGAGAGAQVAGVGGQAPTPDGMTPAGLQQGTRAAGGADLTPAQDVTAARRDPVARQVEAVATTVQASNPYLQPSECRRVARRVVGSYLRQADMASSVMSDEPWKDSPGAQSQGDGGGHTVPVPGLYGAGKDLLGKIPGGGGAAAGAGMLGEAAELAVL